MKRFALLLALLALSPLPAAAPAQAQISALQMRELTGAERAQALAQANASLNAMRSVQGRFIQIAPDGSRSQGDIYLQRPGRLRFAYDPPSPLLIVSDGSVVAIRDKALKTVDAAPLRTTPLFFVLKSNVNLSLDARVSSVARQGPSLLVAVRDKTGQADGDLVMRFDNGALTAWRVIDGQGQVTEIALRDLKTAPKLPSSLFAVRAQGDVITRRPGG